MDETLIFCDANEDRVKNVKAIMFRYEAVSGLKVNFHKSELLRVMVEQPLLSCLLYVLGCKVGKFPRWWKASYLSLSGRFTLILSALLNILIYYLSLFKCPASVADRVERLQWDFLWKGTEQSKK